MEFDDLYQEIILDHYKNPRNFGKMDHGTCELHHENPSCGDSITLYLLIDNGVVQDIRFSGRGCAISMASASMMTELVKGRSVEEAMQLAEKMMGILRGELNEDDSDELGDMEALRGVRQFPMRVKCATLAWHTLEDAIKQQQS